MPLAGAISREDGKSLPAEPGASGDLQAVKAMAAQEERSHSPLCKDCHTSAERQHAYGGDGFRVDTYEEMMTYIKDVVKCEMRDEQFMCTQSHMSYGVHRGKRFTRIGCPCGYDPSEAQWRADVAAFESLTEEEQAAKRKEHTELGAHALQVLYMTPLLHLPMWRIGADQLHLVYLNFFKHLFKYTCHENLPDSKKKSFVST